MKRAFTCRIRKFCRPCSRGIGSWSTSGALGTGRSTHTAVLLSGDNMSLDHARRLAEAARRYGAHINLMPFNPVAGSVHRRPSTEETEAFAEQVAAHGGHCTIRGQRGADIDAACGQLRKRELAM